MALSNDLISQFAKLMNEKKKDIGASVKGTFKVINGKEYVQIDGSDILTPVSTNVEAVADERVVVLIKDHIATVTENITSPAARNKSVQDLKDEVDEFGNTIQQIDNTIIQQGNSIIQMENSINQQGNTINQHDTLINQQGDEIVSINNTIIQQGNAIDLANNTIVAHGNSIDSINNTVIEHGNNINSINNTITEHGNNITSINNTIVQQGNQISQFGDQIVSQGNDITAIDNRVTLQDSNITILNSGFTIVNGVLTGLSQAILDTITVGNLEAEYAKIDFSNIGVAAIEKLFTDSGIIQDLIVENGHITGELIGVTIKGDLIEGNTIVADKLVVLGEDGIYYKLNATAETVEAQQTTQNSLSGSIITASSITASKISVDDLVAFGATIAGFIIDEYSIHSETKSTIASDARGLYFDKDGQFYLGDTTDHVKYYKNEDDEYVLDIRASKIYLGTNTATVNEQIADIVVSNTGIQSTVSALDTRTNSTNDALNDYKEEVSTKFSQVNDQFTFMFTEQILPLIQNGDALSQETLQTIQQYIQFVAGNIILGASNSNFSIKISNEKISFMQGSNEIAYFSNNTLFIANAIIGKKLILGDSTTAAQWQWDIDDVGNLNLGRVGGE